MKRRRRYGALLASWLICQGCADDVGPSPVTVRDSAGIVVVTNRAPILNGEAAWAVSSEPGWIVGHDDGGSSAPHGVSGAVRLSDGSVAIANGGTHEVLVYDSEGARIASFGREGKGPGEFEALGSIWAMPGDSIACWDDAQRIVSIFDRDGVFVRSVSFGSELDDPQRFPNGDFIGLAWTTRQDVPPGGVWWEVFSYVRYSSEGDSLNAIGPLPGIEFMESEWDGRPFRGQRPLGGMAVTGVGPGRFYYGDSRDFRILAFNSDGILDRILERRNGGKPITREIRNRYIEERLRSTSDSMLRARYEEYFSSLTFPEVLPAYQRFETDPEGNLWVQAWELPGDQVTEWSVFSSEGRWITQLSMPRSELLDVGMDYVLLLLRDELGMERVAEFTLEKSAFERGGSGR